MQALHGIKVLDLTHVLAGPFATYQLAVLGADVIKIEHPKSPDQTRTTGSVVELKHEMMGTAYLSQSSNKRAMTLDLKSPDGKTIFRKLAKDADVIVENYRTGALEQLGLGYEDLRALNPKLIYCSITGFGQNGPKAKHTAYDMVIQAVSGIMSLTGTPDVSPLKVGGPVVDYATGTTAAFAITSALFDRERTGRGQKIDVAMLDTTLIMLSALLTDYFCRPGTTPKPRGNDWVLANGSCYQTRDGLLMLGALNAGQHQRLWSALGKPKIAEKSHYSEVEAMNDQLRVDLKAIMLTRTAEEWEIFLNERGVPAGRVRSLSDALGLEQLKHRQSLFHTHDDFPVAGKSIKVPVAGFSYATDGPSVAGLPPRLGQHTDEILRDMGFNESDISAFRATSAI